MFWDKTIVFSIFLLFLSSCKQHKEQVKTDAAFKVEYAAGFSVRQHLHFMEVTVHDPWKEGKVLHNYILVDKAQKLPDKLPQGTLVRTPIDRIVSYSAIQCGVLSELNLLHTIVGVCEPEYIDIPFIRAGIANGSIADLKMASNPDVEKIMMIEPEAILTSPLEDVSYGLVDKINIPMIECTDYMESTPLARAEWIRFHALFHGKQKLADSLFQATVTAYNQLKDLATSAGHRPTVFTEIKYGSSWYVSGGRSYVAALLKDAGAAYCWEEDKHSGAIPMSFETVLTVAEKADFWLIKHGNSIAMSYKNLASTDPLYTFFESYKKKQVFVCNTQHVRYHEELPIHPDYVLKDLIKIFHPELLPDYQLRYYGRMGE